jgi:dihydrodipicolinate synthase/N-acetylneuraminate lyase
MGSVAELRTRLAAVHVYAVTPFVRADIFTIDLDALAANLEFLIEHGVTVVAVGGGTGEIEALTNAELETMTRTALDVVRGRALVIPALPANLGAAVALASRYEALGSVPVALAMPPLIRGRNPVNLDGVLAYYRTLGAATSISLLPYNTQEWPLELFERLAGIDSIVGIKDPCHEPHTLFRAIKLLGDRFVWIGNKKHDPAVLQFRYQMGIDGFTSGMANYLPQYELALHEAALEQDWQRMVALQETVAPLGRLRSLSDDAASVKAGMDLVGLYGGPVRPPRVDLTEAERASLGAALADLDGSHVAVS